MICIHLSGTYRDHTILDCFSISNNHTDGLSNELLWHVRRNAPKNRLTNVCRRRSRILYVYSCVALVSWYLVNVVNVRPEHEKKNVCIYLQRKLARCWYFFDFGWLFRCWKRFELSVGIQRKRKFYICFVCCLFAFVQLITPFKRIIDFDAFALVMRREKIFPHYFCHCCFGNFRFFFRVDSR